ncbi:MAG TPA: ABC-type transport auxiliary lipoprotein family protein [Gemmatimonadales bacterium]|nr:ABC-type transport auxiliary lipoprotein family protein [Gemmatimonadales bacterium]
MLQRGFAIAAALAGAGCGHSLPPLERYRLEPVATADTQGAHPANGRLAGQSIAVEPYEAVGIYGDPQIVYRMDETQYGTYPDREWAVPVSTMLADRTADILRTAPADVTVGLGTQKAGLVWRGTVREFEEVDRGDKVFVAVRLRAMLVRATSDSVIWQGEARAERPVEQKKTMAAVVQALSSASTDAVRQLMAQANGSPGGVARASR